VAHSLYFVVVTATTVGYGDVTPHTVPGPSQPRAARPFFTGTA
jgi:hypothetical protein